jgi:mono/diheme cytochrome c family protein
MSGIRNGLLAIAFLAAPAIALAQQPAANVEKGHETYAYWCASCHGRGNRFPGTVALQAKYGGKVPAVLDDRIDLTPAAVRLFVRRGTSIMPFFRKTEISDSDLDALVAYLTRPRPPAPPAGGR